MFSKQNYYFKWNLNKKKKQLIENIKRLSILMIPNNKRTILQENILNFFIEFCRTLCWRFKFENNYFNSIDYSFGPMKKIFFRLLCELSLKQISWFWFLSQVASINIKILKIESSNITLLISFLHIDICLNSFLQIVKRNFKER